MEVKVTIDSETRDVQLDPLKSESGEEYHAALNGGQDKLKLAVLKRGKDRLVVSINNKVYTILLISRTRGSVSFVANGVSVDAARKSNQLQNEEGSRLATTNELIVSNFPAKIIKLSLKPKDSVKQGETLVVLEAMKMEAQIKAPKDCVVEEVYVKEGDMVERGKPMLRLKFG